MTLNGQNTLCRRHDASFGAHCSNLSEDSMGLSSLKFEQWAPKDASCLRQSVFWPFKVIQGHWRSMILVPIKSAYATSY